MNESTREREARLANVIVESYGRAPDPETADKVRRHIFPHHVEAITNLLVEFADLVESSTAQACYEKAAQHRFRYSTCECGYSFHRTKPTDEQWVEHIRALSATTTATQSPLPAPSQNAERWVDNPHAGYASPVSHSGPHTQGKAQEEKP